MNILFICSRNQWRSPTGESIYRDDPRLAVRSRGTASSARQTIRSADLSWADLVLVMEDKHQSRLRAEFPGETRFLQIEVLHIPDDYKFMDKELVEMIQTAAEPIFDALIERRRN